MISRVPSGWASPKWERNLIEIGDCLIDKEKRYEAQIPIRIIPLADEGFLEKRIAELERLLFESEQTGNFYPKDPEWIKCSERLPEFGDKLIAYYADGSHEILCCTEGRQDDYGMCEVTYRTEGYDLADDEFTHWMPLPAAPESEQNKKTGEV